jgi:hypothetical protein
VQASIETLLACAAGAWWAGLLRRAETPGVERSSPSALPFLLSLTIRENPLTDAQIEIFERVVARDVEEALVISGKASVVVEYEPDDTLKHALQLAGVTRLLELRLPLKTWMIVTRDCIEVGMGYRAPSVPLWLSKRCALAFEVLAAVERDACSGTYGPWGLEREPYEKLVEVQRSLRTAIFRASDSELANAPFDDAVALGIWAARLVT